MPPLEFAAAAWAEVLADDCGALRRRDVVTALAAQYPFDAAHVEADLPWHAWERAGGDGLDAAKLCHPDTGLAATMFARTGAKPSSWRWASLFRRAHPCAPVVVAD